MQQVDPPEAVQLTKHYSQATSILHFSAQNLEATPSAGSTKTSTRDSMNASTKCILYIQNASQLFKGSFQTGNPAVKELLLKVICQYHVRWRTSRGKESNREICTTDFFPRGFKTN